MKKVLILGAGKIGRIAAVMLNESGAYAVTLADSNGHMLEICAKDDAATLVKVDVTDEAALTEVAKGHDAILSTCPFYLNVAIARVARAVGASYFDVTEDVETTRAIRDIAKDADGAFVPQCGLAPGFISIAAHDLFKRFDSVQNLRLRVGALPQNPTNRLKYNLTWSTDGLINEYLNPCEAIHKGKRIEVLPLEGYERFTIDGTEYEAFNTSGGVGALCDMLEGKVENLDYKTVRYPGHQEILKILIEDLGLGKRPDLMKEIFEKSLPITSQDVIVIFADAIGTRDGELCEENFIRKVHGTAIGGRNWSAIQITTSAGLCAVMDMVLTGTLAGKGYIRQEQVALDDFLANRFGRYFSHEG
ncbi:MULTISPECIES: saccharopine dehydrogenase family protein [Thalassospira]|uniref:Saccharopine dehydrogenase, NADP-dependent n=1 Tax=Thalassospira xiamenensis TaxID=220697 RepID=A0A285REK1_9PROT|nr:MULTISPECIES: saccharopine dehydrogenase C-terminal domain-containing protein [Thalassospira]MAZ35462.1 saccharopine dehydrogenase [Thalassospira sp.]RCK33314.1 saccharopine dehydrogenase [Thalassospira xiamenensis]WOI10206.1 saccharopine dehydrogenase C-terminal domain-containing protein [Thalassospira lucentensis]SOB92501.1 Saccharopine dehydrogenase, NADP-dependent [Thalassospira xiamenensis]